MTATRPARQHHSVPAQPFPHVGTRLRRLLFFAAALWPWCGDNCLTLHSHKQLQSLFIHGHGKATAGVARLREVFQHLSGDSVPHSAQAAAARQCGGAQPACARVFLHLGLPLQHRPLERLQAVCPASLQADCGALCHVFSHFLPAVARCGEAAGRPPPGGGAQAPVGDAAGRPQGGAAHLLVPVVPLCHAAALLLGRATGAAALGDGGHGVALGVCLCGL